MARKTEFVIDIPSGGSAADSESTRDASVFSNETSFGRAEDVVPTVVRSVIDLVLLGPIYPQRKAIVAYLGEKAIDRAIDKLRSLKKEK